MHSNKFETQIDTWTNDSAQNGDKDAPIGGEWPVTNPFDALHVICSVSCTTCVLLIR